MHQKEKALKIIKRHVIWAMGGGFIPISLLDIASMTAIQIDMLKQLAKLYGVEYSTAKGKTFVSALTGRSLASIGATAIKALPGVGTLLGGVSMSVMSGASTYAVGKVATELLETGDDLFNVDLASAKKRYEDSLAEGKTIVSDIEQG